MEEELISVYNELIESFKSLKAEIFISEIFEKSNLDFSDIDIYNNSTFSRSYRRDVIDVNIDTISSDKEKLKLNLARNGLYDTLPEGLFHDKKQSRNQSYKEISQKNKEEEKAARKFFAPLENEFFVQKVKIEQNKRQLINKFADLQNDFLINFWGLDKDCPEEYNLKMLKVLPFAHKISGKISSVEACLAHILEDKVSIKREFKTIENIKEPKEINSIRLDVDFTLKTERSLVQYPVYKIEIGPLSIEKANMYRPKGEKMKFISTFSEYFVPMDVDVDVSILQEHDEDSFLINEEKPLRLGLTTVL